MSTLGDLPCPLQPAPSASVNAAMVNDILTDELCALNAIYGEGTLQITQTNNKMVTAMLRLPSTGISFRIEFAEDYPSHPPVIEEPDLPLHLSMNRRIQNMRLLIFQVLHSIFVPGTVCMFDLLDACLPLILCLKEDGLDSEMAWHMVYQTSEMTDVQAQWRWTYKERIDMSGFADMLNCTICFEDGFAFQMIAVPCGHYFCYSCFQAGWEIASNEVNAYTCCHIRVPLPTIQQCTDITEEQSRKYQKMLIDKDIENPFYCTQRSCGELIGSFNAWQLSRGRVRNKGILCPHCKGARTV
ncbi:hypothetical protein OHC33_010454 [Knufia fluminis]|uniref:RING-type domain-containing protein n=1 Tax=Knufia fluminis TaxID=191047 RepID=A0AAN8E905_9EURO|nr:hypothetical protein OHC33_010454 [Knufia fluminis]